MFNTRDSEVRQDVVRSPPPARLPVRPPARLVLRLAMLAGVRVPGLVAALGRAIGHQRSRWPLWLPVALAAGIAVYFALPSEPPIWLGAGVAVFLGATAHLVRRHEAVYWAALLLAAGALGGAVATLRTAHVGTVQLDRAVWADVTGTLEKSERRPGDWRITVSDVQLAATRSDIPAVTRVRLVLRGQSDMPPLGTRVRLRARLMPPQAPVSPGGFDFRRWAYFAELGAVGFAVGDVVIVRSAVEQTGLMAVDGLRLRIADRLRRAMSTTAGPVAAALLVGDRSGLDPETVEAFRASGLAHLLAISGLHMGMVAGMLFVATRFLLSCVPALALRHPIKKWAALVALSGSGIYLLLAGAPVPTQRAFVMTGLVLLGVVLDREAVTLRLVALAACIVLLLTPEVLTGPSFQLSFAAVVALVAVYEAWRAHRRRRMGGEERRFTVIWRIVGYALGVAATSAIAGAATAPFTAFHFQAVAPGGLLANLLAVPLTGFVTMPAGLAAGVLMTVGAEAPALTVMEVGITATLAVAAGTVDLLGPALTVPPMPIAAIGALAFAGCWGAVWRGPLRLFGLGPAVLALYLWTAADPPDVLVSPDGRMVALNLGAAGWVRSPSTASGFIQSEWARRWGVHPVVTFEQAAARGGGDVACDDLGCLIRAPGRLISVPVSAQAAAEDCPHVDVVLTRVRLRRACRGPAVVIDATALRQDGAHAVWFDGAAVRVRSVGRERGNRPWTR